MDRPFFSYEEREWERVFSQKVISDLDVNSFSRQAVVKLTLPGRVV